ncbi:NAD(P)-binding protein [Trichodelitschia bisporula]|uniref:NAD(P)-binding protein n=1 Tax=Trichodelitschia bisporula TaxID=703511 RepID=A0A6G1HJF7_9PEZI|nr:NAD(P)-binding protein [Trichodelitschia bisporula]
MAAQGKVIIVTGASRGIGLAIAEYLLQKQNRLVVVARTKQPLEELERKYPNQVAPLAGDFSDFSLGKKAVDLAKSTWNQLDGLVVNHGTLSPVKRIADSSAEDWRAGFDTNFFSAVAIVKAALPDLRVSKGRIVFTSSGAATGAYVGWGPYGASKAAMNHLTLTLASEEPDVTSISIRPGVVDTAMQQDLREFHHKSMDSEEVQKFFNLKSSNQLLRPEQPGHVMAKLVLDAPRDLSGRFISWNDPALSAFQES